MEQNGRLENMKITTLIFGTTLMPVWNYVGYRSQQQRRVSLVVQCRTSGRWTWRNWEWVSSCCPQTGCCLRCCQSCRSRRQYQRYTLHIHANTRVTNTEYKQHSYENRLPWSKAECMLVFIVIAILLLIIWNWRLIWFDSTSKYLVKTRIGQNSKR